MRLLHLTPTYLHAFLPALAADHQAAAAAAAAAAAVVAGAAGAGVAEAGAGAGAGAAVVAVPGAAAGAERHCSQPAGAAATAAGDAMQEQDEDSEPGPCGCKRGHAESDRPGASPPEGGDATAGDGGAASEAGTTGSGAPPLGWFPITPAEAAFVANLAAARSEPERQALIAAGSRRFGRDTIASGWYSPGRRQQYLSGGGGGGGRMYEWSISRSDLEEELEGKAPGERFLVESQDEVAARGFVWVPYVKGKVGESAAALFLRASLPAAFEVPGSALNEGLTPAVMPLDAEMSVQRVVGWEEDPFVVLRGPAARAGRVRRDVRLRFWADGDVWVLGKGRGHKALPLRAGVGAGAGAGEEEGVLAPWGEYLRDGDIRGTLTILPPSDLV